MTTPGVTGCGSAGGILISTGETLAQVQNRLLPIGATINGVTVLNNDTAVPLFPSLPGYGLIGVRGAFRLGERSEVFLDFENIADKQYRGISWGVDGAGRGLPSCGPGRGCGAASPVASGRRGRAVAPRSAVSGP